MIPKTKPIIAIVVSILFFTSFTYGAPQITTSIEVDGFSEADALKAIETLRKNCLPLGTVFWSDVTKIEVDIAEEFAPYRLERGWKNSFWVRLTYSDHPKFGPSYAPEAGVLAGDTLHYFLGGGLTPGFLAKGRSSQYLCSKRPFEDKRDIFISVPELHVLDGR